MSATLDLAAERADKRTEHDARRADAAATKADRAARRSPVPITWVTDEPCSECGRPGRIEGPYAVCPECWAKQVPLTRGTQGLRIVHVRERERMAERFAENIGRKA